MPSAGLPMARLLAMVSGLTGRIASVPALYAVATGPQPVAWAPKIRYSLASTRPSLISSWKALSTLVSWERTRPG